MTKLPSNIEQHTKISVGTTHLSCLRWITNALRYQEWPNSQIIKCTCSISHNAPFNWIEHRGYGAGAFWDWWNWSILLVTTTIEIHQDIQLPWTNATRTMIEGRSSQLHSCGPRTEEIQRSAVVRQSVFSKIITISTPYLARAGEIWGVFCECKPWLMFCLGHCSDECIIVLYWTMLQRNSTVFGC